MHEDPWHDLATPASPTAISARRANEANPWDVFWAVDYDRQSMLIVCHTLNASVLPRLPRLREIEVGVETAADGRPMFVLRLLESSLRDIFYRLCSDIIVATERCVTESDAVDAAVARTWRWHHLLRGGGTGLLRPDDQKGLLGELLVLERYIIPAIGPVSAVNAWHGPLGAAKDFIAGSIGIECKARGTADAGSVPISSEFQLEDDRLEHLFLHTCTLDPAMSDGNDAFTLTEVVQRLRGAILVVGENVTNRYDALLAAAGFRYEDDYADQQWIGGERAIYRVTGAFPRLTPAVVPACITRVSYVLTLSDASAFVVTPTELLATLSRTNQ